jgi:Outer membrane protein beta-barrel domain
MVFGAALALVAACAPSGARAQLSENAGPLLNVHLAHSTVAGTGDFPESRQGGNLGVTVGYGFGERVALVLALDAAAMGSGDGAGELPDDGFRLYSGTLGVRFNFGNPGLALRPYLQTGFTVVSTSEATQRQDDILLDFKTSGTGISLGGGMQWFLSPKLSVDGALHVTQGAMNEVTIYGTDQDRESGLGFDASRIELGATWHP